MTFYAPRSVKSIRKDALELLETDENKEMFAAAMMLFAMLELGTTNPDTLASYLGIPRAQARRIAKRFRDNQVWVGGNKLGVDEDLGIDDPGQVSAMFLLMSLCGSGEIVRK